MKNILIHSVAILGLASCTAKQNFNNSEQTKVVTESDVVEVQPEVKPDDGLLSDEELTKLSNEEMVCQQGPRITALVQKADFSSVFAAVCTDGAPNETYKQLIKDKFNGEGAPKVTLISSKSDENLTTELILGYVINVPMEKPSEFSSYKSHNILAAVESTSSKMQINVVSREEFPGRRSVEAIKLDYKISRAKGAGIYDVRSTEFNTYLLKEDYRDVVLSTEHITDAETNKNYHSTPGLTIGIANGDGRSDLMFISKLVVKERVDPSRIESALTDLNSKVAEMIHSHIINSQK